MASNRALSVQRRVVTLDKKYRGGEKKKKCSGWIQAICLQNNKVSFLREGKNSFFRRLAAQHITHNNRAFVFSLTFRALQSQKGCCIMMFASFSVGGWGGRGALQSNVPSQSSLDSLVCYFLFSPLVSAFLQRQRAPLSALPPSPRFHL